MTCYVYGMIKGEVSQLRVITKISSQKKRLDRYNIFLDDAFAFAVDQQLILTHQLKKGKQLSEEEVNRIIHAEGFQKSYLMAVKYLGYRMRSEAEMRTYLTRKEIDELEIDRIIVQLFEKKFLNDEQFARAFVNDRMNQTSKGPIVIRRELAEKGIKHKLADDALKAYSYEEQYETALKWANKQEGRRSNHSFRKKQEQLRMKLMQRGFDKEVIQDVFDELQSEIDVTDERVALEYHAEKLHRKYSSKFSGYELTQKLKSGLYTKRFPGELIDEYIEKITEDMVN